MVLEQVAHKRFPALVFSTGEGCSVLIFAVPKGAVPRGGCPQ